MRRVASALLVATLLAGASRADEETEGRRHWLVLGPDGRRLEAVVVSVAEPGAGGRPVGGRAVFDAAQGGETKTLAEGLLELPAHDGPGVVLWGPGLAALRAEAAPGVVGLRLAQAVPLTGTLRFDRGDAAASLVVLARRTPDGDLVHRTRTDEDGTWRFAHTGPGAWTVAVRRGDGRLQSLGVFTAGQRTSDAPIVLEPGSRVEGQILDGDALERTGLGGLRFVLARLPGGEAAAEDPFETAEDGTFVLDDVPAGIYEAHLVDEAHFFDPRAPRVQVPARGLVRLRGWYALGGRTVEGRVEGPGDTRVTDADVVLVPDATLMPPPGGWPVVPPARTDAAGRFTLSGVRPATGYRLAVAAPGYASIVTSPFDVSGPKPTTVPTVMLRTGWRLEVLTRAPGGAPRAGIEILALPADHPVAPGEPGWRALARRAVTDAEGQAVLADMPEGDIRVLATAPTVLDETGLVTVPASGEIRTWTATLFPAPRIEGRIEAAGEESPGALRVRAVSHGTGRVRTTDVGPDGRFAFAGLGAEPLDLEIVRAGEPDGLVLARIEGVIPGSSPEVLVTLPASAAIEGRVEDAVDGGPPVTVRLEAPLFDAERDAYRWRTVASMRPDPDDPRRTFRFDGLAPGTYAVRAVQGENDSGAATVRLEEEETESLELLLPEVGRIAGTVLLDTDDLPVLGAEVRLVRLRGDGDAPGRPEAAPRRATDADGAYVFADVAPGVWRVEVRDGHAAQDQETLRVTEGESVVLRDLFVRRGGVLGGTVHDGEGRALDGALLELESVEEGPDARSARTGRDGAFRIEGLRPGVWRVRLAARAGPFTDLETLVEVDAHEATELDLTAPGRGRIVGRVWRRGRPVPDLPIHLVSRPGGDAGLARRRTARADAEGRFGFEGLPAGAYEVDVADGGVWSTRSVALEDGDLLTLDLEAWEGRLVGEVVGTAGAPIASATVLARPRTAGAEALVGRVRTDPQGRFLIVGLPVGRYDLEAYAPGLPPGRLLDATAEVEGAERPVTLILGRGGTLDLTVTGPDGRGVAGARVWLEDEQGVALHGRPYVTGYQGRLRLVGTMPGRLWVRATARRYGRPARTPVVVVEGEERAIRIQLPLPGRLTVVVRGDRLDALPRAHIALLRLPDREPVVRAHALTRSRLEPLDGRLPRGGVVVYDELAPGAYIVQVDATPRFELAEVPYEIGALDDGELEIDLVPAR